MDLVHLLYQLSQLSSCPTKILFVPYLNDHCLSLALKKIQIQNLKSSFYHKCIPSHHY